MHKNHTVGRKHLLMAMVAILIVIVGDQSLAANYPLEIIQPRPGLTTANRFYRAYPGLEYNVRVAVIGGDYPYRYELLVAPSGMSIDQNTGVITWASPTTAGSPHTVTARVRDLGASGGGEGAGGTQASVTWTITVTTSQFIFVDAVNGSDSNDGSINSPKRTFAGFTTTAGTFANYFVYFKNGTYNPSTANATQFSCWGGSNVQVQFNSSQPIVWLAYPGHSPTVDLSTKVLGFFGGSTNAYLDGITFTPISNPCRYGFNFDSSASNVTFRRNTFRTLPVTSASNNQSQIFISAGATGQFYAITENTFDDVDHGYFILGYSAQKVLIAGNTFTNIRDTAGQGGFHAIGLKVSCVRWHVINNRLSQINGNGLWYMYADVHGQSGNTEFAYNLVQNTAVRTAWINQNQNAGMPVYIYRNTLVNGSVLNDGLLSNAGPFTYTRNVIVNSDPQIRCNFSCTDSSRLVEVENLQGTAADGIVSGNGNLQGTYRTLYLGKRGYELGGAPADSTPPATPTSLRFQ